MPPPPAAPVSGVTASAQVNTATPQPSSMDNALQMLLARVVSLPLATVFFNSLVGFQPASALQPAGAGALPGAQLLQMMRQGFQTAATSAQPQMGVLPSAAAQDLPTRAPSPSSSATSSDIQLAQMETSAAREMAVQLVQQLQQAGQLAHGDVIQFLLQPSADTTSQQHVPPVKVQKDDAATEQFDEKPLCVISKTESLASTSGGVRPGLDVGAKKENIATEQSTEQNPLCVISNTVSMAEAEPPRVYMDIAEDINYTVSGGVRRGMDRCSDEDEGVDRRRKSHAGMVKNRQPVVPRDEPCAQTKCVVKLVKLDLRDMARKTVSTPPVAHMSTPPVQTSTVSLPQSPITAASCEEPAAQK